MAGDPASLAHLPGPRTKAELLERIPRARAALEETITRLSESELDAAGPEGWSVKDHLAHIAAWERMIVAHLRDGSAHAVVQMDETTYAAKTLDELNEAIYQQHKDLPPARALADFRQAHREILGLLEGMDEAAFWKPYWPDDPERRPVMDKVAGDTYRHYLEHRAWIQDLPAARGQ